MKRYYVGAVLCGGIKSECNSKKIKIKKIVKKMKDLKGSEFGLGKALRVKG